MTGCPFSSRRSFIGGAGGLFAAAAALGRAKAQGVGGGAGRGDGAAAPAGDERVLFHGVHQAGIDTPQQTHVVFASFNLIGDSAAELVGMLQAWTAAAARMTMGQTAAMPGDDPAVAPADSGETIGTAPQRLTLTFGFGPGLFEKDGKDRYGVRAKRPAALVELPRFNGDQLDPGRSGGDVCIQACADDPMVAFHAVRQLARMAAPNDAANGYGGKRAGATTAYDAKPGVAVLRWMQAGFLPDSPAGETPRNLLGFKDGTQNPGSPHPAERAGGKLLGNGTFQDAVWAGDDGPAWMLQGSYMVVRRIRLALEHWDRMELDFQEQVIGRRKRDGGPLTGGGEFAPLDLDAVDKDGNPVIPGSAHVRLAAASVNDGARILRRGYSYNDGLSMVAERWPPWRQGLEYDAGLLFIAYQSDPRTGFIRIFDGMSKLDMLNQFATHVGSGIFACPGGVADGEFVGQRLFDAA